MKKFILKQIRWTAPLLLAGGLLLGTAIYAALPLSAIPKLSALFETSLASKISSTATSMTLVSGTDKSGNTLSGVYGFILDEGSATEEFVLGTATGTSITGMLRGVSVTDGGTEVTALKKEHRRGASVKITSFPFLGIVYRLLQGSDGFPQKLFYNSHPTFTTNTELVDKGYVDGVAVAGAPNADDSTKGIVEQGTTAEIDAGTGAGSTGARLFINPEKLSTSIYATRLPASGEKSALVGTLGTPGSGNKYVTNDDTATSGNSKIIRTGSGGHIDSTVTNQGISATFAESIDGTTTPQAVFVANSDAYSERKLNYATADTAVNVYGANWKAQTFTTTATTTRLESVELYLNKTGSPSGNFTVGIYATSGGNPTGAALGTVSLTANNVGASSNWYKFTFSTPVTVSASTVYAIVANATSGDVSNYIIWYRANSNVYSSGAGLTSSDSGGSWSDIGTVDFTFRVWGYDVLTSGQVYKSDAGVIERLKFNGFAVDNITAASTGTVINSGIVNGFTGLTPGSVYYVTDTAGAISTTVGTYKVPVGYAVSTTQILISKTTQNTMSGYTTIEDNFNKEASPITKDIKIFTGFRPSHISLDTRASIPGTTATETYGTANFESTTFKNFGGFLNSSGAFASTLFDIGNSSPVTLASSSTDRWSCPVTINAVDSVSFTIRIVCTAAAGSPTQIGSTAIKFGWAAQN